MDKGKPYYILAGISNSKRTKIAKKMLDEAGINYRVHPAIIDDGPLPQLFTGLTVCVGLGDIACFASAAQNRRSLEMAC